MNNQRWLHFQTVGNNTRLLGKHSIEAQKIIDTIGESIEDHNNFWHGYHRGKNTEIIDINSKDK